jgi:transposase-like protein
MKAGSIMTSHGQFEADETLMGGLEKNMHAHKKSGKTGRGTGKAVVMAIVRRKTAGSHSKVKTVHVKDASQATLQPIITSSIEPGSHLYTDAWQGYRGLAAEYRHQVVDHAVEYVRGAVHTNSAENFFSLLKRTVKGTYVSVEPFHLGAYLDEQAFRFNERGDNDGGRFTTLLGAVFGLRLTYKELIGHGAQPA